jgi:hypothetical protein
MNILITPPETHFDRGLGISAWRFKDAANILIDAGNTNDLVSPIGYLQRHAIELYLKSLIFILHKKYNIDFGDDFSLDNPAISANGKWRPFSNTHNLSDLYGYFRTIFDSHFDMLPKSTDWTISEKLKNQIDPVSGYDPKSTYFRYPKASSESQDEKKSTVQPMDLASALAAASDSISSTVKCAVMLDSEDNVVATYDLVSDPIKDVRKALSEIMDGLYNLHSVFLGELTKWS